MFRKANVFLVPLDGRHILVDQNKGVMHEVNDAGAYAWTMLGQEPVDQSFINDLQQMDLVASTDQGNVESPVPAATGTPTLVAASQELGLAAGIRMQGLPTNV